MESIGWTAFGCLSFQFFSVTSSSLLASSSLQSLESKRAFSRSHLQILLFHQFLWRVFHRLATKLALPWSSRLDVGSLSIIDTIEKFKCHSRRDEESHSINSKFSNRLQSLKFRKREDLLWRFFTPEALQWSSISMHLPARDTAIMLATSHCLLSSADHVDSGQNLPASSSSVFWMVSQCIRLCSINSSPHIALGPGKQVER